jgi:hypothetical protein
MLSHELAHLLIKIKERKSLFLKIPPFPPPLLFFAVTVIVIFTITAKSAGLGLRTALGFDLRKNNHTNLEL